jgi:hypothetical protein
MMILVRWLLGKGGLHGAGLAPALWPSPRKSLHPVPTAAVRRSALGHAFEMKFMEYLDCLAGIDEGEYFLLRKDTAYRLRRKWLNRCAETGQPIRLVLCRSFGSRKMI